MWKPTHRLAFWDETLLMDRSSRTLVQLCLPMQLQRVSIWLKMMQRLMLP